MGAELDKILEDEYLTNSTRRELEEYIKQYGIQERIDEVEGHSPVDRLHSTGLSFNTGQLLSYATIYKRVRVAELTALKEE